MDAMSAPLSGVQKAVVKLATKDGIAGGTSFATRYSLGQNPNVDAMILEGLETNVSLVIQRLPWATIVPELSKIPTIRALFLRIPLDPDSLASEVTDDIVWTYMATYDQASRKVIRDTISKNRKG